MSNKILSYFEFLIALLFLGIVLNLSPKFGYSTVVNTISILSVIIILFSRSTYVSLKNKPDEMSDKMPYLVALLFLIPIVIYYFMFGYYFPNLIVVITIIISYVQQEFFSSIEIR